MVKLIEKTHTPPAFPLAPHRVESMATTTLAFSGFLEHSAAYQSLLDRRYQAARKSNRAADRRGEYMLGRDGQPIYST